MQIEQIIDGIMNELKKAEYKHPGWPDDVIHCAAIMAEEAGEALQASIDCFYKGDDENFDALKKELFQTGAMVIRNLLHLE